MKRIVTIAWALALTAAGGMAQPVHSDDRVQDQLQDTTQYERRPFQFTFLTPPLSTNGFRNASIVNDLSLNLFIGLSGGTEVFEAGGFINIDRYYMHGVQLAGFGNTVGGHATGVQLSGFYNVNGSWFTGMQGAGFVNLSGGGVEGFQAAGFMNIAGGKLKGLQASGFMNVAGGSDQAVQFAGFGNLAGRGKTSMQASGFVNVAQEVEGAQLAGFINVAGRVTGTQISGFINICDSIDGVPVSLISIVKKNGYRKLGFAASEVQYASVIYKMGVPRFYNIYSFGKPFGPGSRWMIGGGVGTQLALNESTLLNVEAATYQELWVANPDSPLFLHMDRLNMYNSLKFLFGWNMGDQLDLHVGPTLNVSVSDTNTELGSVPYYPIPPYSISIPSRPSWRQTNVQMWVGIEGSITF